MLKASKILLILAGFLLVFDAILIVARNPFGWPLPHPITITTPGIGLILFAFGSKAFKKD